MSFETLLDQVDPLVLMAERQDVEAGDIDPMLVSLRRLLEPGIPARVRQKLAIVVNGYDNDSRELFEIPEVRAWTRKLDAQFPFWFFFLHTRPGSSLSWISLCFCNARLTTGGYSIPPQEMEEMLSRMFAAMNHICDSIGDSEQNIQAMTNSVMGRLFPGSLASGHNKQGK